MTSGLRPDPALRTIAERVLGIAGARVVGGELPVATAHEKFDAHGRLVDRLLADRLRLHIATLVNEAQPLSQAA